MIGFNLTEGLMGYEVVYLVVFYLLLLYVSGDECEAA